MTVDFCSYQASISVEKESARLSLLPLLLPPGVEGLSLAMAGTAVTVEAGEGLAKALRQAGIDPELKMKYFTDPITFKRRRLADFDDNTGGRREGKGKKQKVNINNLWNQWTQWSTKGKAKGAKGKGGGKGKGSKDKRVWCQAVTPPPESKPICFAFNRHNEHCDGGCGREHVCGVCFKPNKPMYACDHKP